MVKIKDQKCTFLFYNSRGSNSTFSDYVIYAIPVIVIVRWWSRKTCRWNFSFPPSFSKTKINKSSVSVYNLSTADHKSAQCDFVSFKYPQRFQFSICISGAVQQIHFSHRRIGSPRWTCRDAFSCVDVATCIMCRRVSRIVYHVSMCIVCRVSTCVMYRVSTFIVYCASTCIVCRRGNNSLWLSVEPLSAAPDGSTLL